MAFEIKNPTLKQIINFIKSIKNHALQDPSEGNIQDTWGLKNGTWSKIQDSGGGGSQQTNIGDNVYIDGKVIHSKTAEMQVKDFLDKIAPEFNDVLSYSTGDLVIHDNELYRFTGSYTPPGSWETAALVCTSTTIENILQVKADTTYVDTEVNKREVLIKTINSISSLPQTYNNMTGVESDMIPITMDLSNPATQMGDWTITTGTDTISISGTINGTTNVTLYLMKTR